MSSEELRKRPFSIVATIMWNIIHFFVPTLLAFYKTIKMWLYPWHQDLEEEWNSYSDYAKCRLFLDPSLNFVNLIVLFL